MGQIQAGGLAAAKEWSSTQRVVEDSTDGQGLSGCARAQRLARIQHVARPFFGTLS